MSIGYKILIYTIIIEFSLVALLIAFSYILRILYFFIKKKREESKEAFREILHHAMISGAAFDFNAIRKRWHDLHVLLVWIKEMDEANLGDQWQEQRKSLIKQVILPLARKYSHSRLWPKRLQAAKAYTLDHEVEDEDNIIHLLRDPVPLIHYEAMLCVRKLGTTKMVDSFIDLMSHEPRRSRVIYHNTCAGIAEKTYDHILNRLNKASDENVRASCYELLVLHHGPSFRSPRVYDDILSESPRLSIAAILFVRKEKDVNAIPAVKQAIKREEPDVVSEAIVALKDLGAIEDILGVSNLLSSHHWWVRFNAAFALKSIGEQGEAVLMEHKNSKDKHVREIVEYVLP